MGVESMLEPFMRQAELFTLAYPAMSAMPQRELVSGQRLISGVRLRWLRHRHRPVGAHLCSPVRWPWRPRPSCGPMAGAPPDARSAIAAWKEADWPVIKGRRAWAPGSAPGDESGQGLRPPKGRTWGPPRPRPIVRVTARNSPRLSVAALICVKPGYRPRLIYRTRTGEETGS